MCENIDFQDLSIIKLCLKLFFCAFKYILEVLTVALHFSLKNSSHKLNYIHLN